MVGPFSSSSWYWGSSGWAGCNASMRLRRAPHDGPMEGWAMWSTCRHSHPVATPPRTAQSVATPSPPRSHFVRLSGRLARHTKIGEPRS